MARPQAFEGRIEYSEALLRQLEDQLSVAIANAKGKVRLTRRPRDSGEYFFCGVQFMNEEINKRYTQPDAIAYEWNLAKALRKGAATASVWVGVRLRFDSEGEGAYLASASVLVLAFRDALYPLVRAEWDYRGFCDARHAQPHWHVLTALQADTELRALADNIPQEFVAAYPDTRLRQSEALHLAMSTDWPALDGERFVCDLPDKGNLRNWVVKTVNYSIDQVQYALAKSGESPTPVKDFVFRSKT
jgi:hypothetical protein